MTAEDRIPITKFAELTGYSRRTIHRWIDQGILTPHRTPGGLPYFLKEDVDALNNPTPETIDA